MKLGTPVSNCSLSRNNVHIPFSETSWSRALSLVYIALCRLVLGCPLSIECGS